MAEELEKLDDTNELVSSENVDNGDDLSTAELLPKEEKPEVEDLIPIAEIVKKIKPVADPIAFDWSVNKRGANIYTAEKQLELENLYDSTFKAIEEDKIVQAQVTLVTESDVVLNIGFKSDGLVPRSEFRDLPDLKAGDYVDVYVESKENKKGR